MKRRIQRLERLARIAAQKHLDTLTEEEYLCEFLHALEHDYGAIDRGLAEAFITGTGGDLQEWGEILDRVLAEQCEPVGGKQAQTWRFKKEEGRP